MQLFVATKHTYISDLAIKIIIHARRTILFDGQNIWVKKNNSNFDVGMGAFDGAEVCELIGLYMLHLIIFVHKILQRKILAFTEMTCLVLTAVEDPKWKGIKRKLSRFSKIIT